MIKWHRVELHTHTIASDGIMEPAELVRRARNRGYEAIVVTDHNTTTSCPATMAAGEKEGLIVIPGIEWTTFWGHIVVTGGKSRVDWRTVNLENIYQKLQEAKKDGDLITVAHPKRLGTPFCSECRFLYKLDNWDQVDAYEVWSHYNPHTAMESQKTKKEWSELINMGYKIAPVYGYDWHNPDEGGPAYAYTYVGIDGEVTKESIMKAIKKNHVYITMGTEVDAYVTKDGKRYEFGDSISKGDAKLHIKAEIVKEFLERFKLEIKGLKIYKDGKILLAKKWDGSKLDMDINLDCKNIRLEVYGRVNDEDADIAILAPLYID